MSDTSAQTMDDVIAQVASMGFELASVHDAISAGNFTSEAIVDYLTRNDAIDSSAADAAAPLLRLFQPEQQQLQQQQQQQDERNPLPRSTASSPAPAPAPALMAFNTPLSASTAPSPATAAPKPASPSPAAITSRINRDSQAEYHKREAEKIAEQMRKKKEQEQLERKRVLEQLEADKRRRAGIPAPEKSPTMPSAPVSLPSPASTSSSSANIQIRLPNAAIIKHQFMADAVFQEVVDAVAAQLGSFSFATHSIAQTFPNRSFSEAARSETLRSLGLAPSATLVVRGPSSSAAVPAAAPAQPQPVYRAVGGSGRLGYGDEEPVAADTQPQLQHTPEPVTRSWGGGFRLDEVTPVAPTEPAVAAITPPAVDPEPTQPALTDAAGSLSASQLQEARLRALQQRQQQSRAAASAPSEEAAPAPTPAPTPAPASGRDAEEARRSRLAALERRLQQQQQQQAQTSAPASETRPATAATLATAAASASRETPSVPSTEREQRLQRLAQQPNRPAGEAPSASDSLLSQFPSGVVLSPYLNSYIQSQGGQNKKSKPAVMHTLADLCLKKLAKIIATPGGKRPLPLSRLSEDTADALVKHLAQQKALNEKTLTLFLRCYLRRINLDGYFYITNDLLHSMRFFVLLEELSIKQSQFITHVGIQYISGLPNLRVLDVGGSRLDDNSVPHLSSFPALSVLGLEGTFITDAGLAALAPLGKTLVSLDIGNCSKLTTDGLQALQNFPLLRSLNLTKLPLKDLSTLPEFRDLRSLNLSRTLVTAASMKHINRYPLLMSLSLTQTEIDDSGVYSLRYLQHLTSLTLPSRLLITDGALAHISSLPLVELDLSDYIHITDEGIKQLSRLAPSLKALSLANTKMTDDSADAIAGLLHLESLSLDRTAVGDAGIAKLMGLKYLRYLSLSRTRISDAYFVEPGFETLPSLETLNLSSTRVTDEGIERLKSSTITSLNLDSTMVTDRVPFLLTGLPALVSLRIVGINSHPDEYELERQRRVAAQATLELERRRLEALENGDIRFHRNDEAEDPDSGDEEAHEHDEHNDDDDNDDDDADGDNGGNPRPLLDREGAGIMRRNNFQDFAQMGAPQPRQQQGPPQFPGGGRLLGRE